VWGAGFSAAAQISRVSGRYGAAFSAVLWDKNIPRGKNASPTRLPLRLTAGGTSLSYRMFACCILQAASMTYTPHLSIWDMAVGPVPMFFLLFICQKIVQLVYYRSVVQTAQTILHELLLEEDSKSG
jgi:hypothetical protein